MRRPMGFTSMTHSVSARAAIGVGVGVDTFLLAGNLARGASLAPIKGRLLAPGYIGVAAWVGI